MKMARCGEVLKSAASLGIPCEIAISSQIHSPPMSVCCELFIDEERCS